MKIQSTIKRYLTGKTEVTLYNTLTEALEKTRNDLNMNDEFLIRDISSKKLLAKGKLEDYKETDYAL